MAWYPFCCLVVDETFDSDAPTTVSPINPDDWEFSGGAAKTSTSGALLLVLNACSARAKLVLTVDESWNCPNSVKAYMLANDDRSKYISIEMTRADPSPQVPGDECVCMTMTVTNSGTVIFETHLIISTVVANIIIEVDPEVTYTDYSGGLLSVYDNNLSAPILKQSIPFDWDDSFGTDILFGSGTAGSEISFPGFQVYRQDPPDDVCCATISRYDTCWQDSPCDASPLGVGGIDDDHLEWWNATHPSRWTLGDYSAEYTSPGGGACNNGDGETGSADRILRYYLVRECTNEISIHLEMHNCLAGFDSLGPMTSASVKFARVCPINGDDYVDYFLPDLTPGVLYGAADIHPEFADPMPGICSCLDPSRDACNEAQNDTCIAATPEADVTVRNVPPGLYVFDVRLNRAGAGCFFDIPQTTINATISGELVLLESCS